MTRASPTLSPYAQRKADRLRLLRGEYLHVDATETRDHVRRLIAAYLPAQSIALAAGVSPAFVSGLVNGRYQRIHNGAARALLAVGFTPLPIQTTVTGCGVTRRVHALARVGWSLAYQAEALGLPNQSNLTRLISAPTVRYERWRAVFDLYREHSEVGGPCHRAATWAARHGWAAPAAWDLRTLDNPYAWPRNRPLWTPDDFVDLRAVRAARAGLLPAVQLSPAERVALAEQMGG
ncbi:hypothetical protein ACWEVP_31900 [Amycolatopsis sp. NPDC003865]